MDVGGPVSVNGNDGGEVLKVGRASGEPNRAKRVVAGRQIVVLYSRASHKPDLARGCAIHEPNGTNDDKTSRLAHRRKICKFDRCIRRLKVLNVYCRDNMGRMHAPGKGICMFPSSVASVYQSLRIFVG